MLNINEKEAFIRCYGSSSTEHTVKFFPTPVSALLHAATLVTAGIYLLLRSSPIIEYSPDALLILVILGSTTSFFAATCGLVGNDLKRIIAFSTISQLGYYLLILLAFGWFIFTLSLNTLSSAAIQPDTEVCYMFFGPQ